MQANMARHHVFAALCAYGAPWAIAQALDHHWPRLIFAGDTSFLRHCDQVEYMRGTPQEFAASIAAMVVRRGLDDAAYALVERGLVSTLDVREALVGDHADLMERMILSGYFDAKMARDPSTLWRRAAKKRAVRCIERLMVTPNLAITPQPPLSPFAGRKRPRCHHTSRLLRRWQEHAIRADCYEMLQLCDRHGVEFRTATAIKQAAVFASMATLRWLWARGSRTGQAAHDCVSQQERLPRLEEVALFAVSEPTPRYRVRSTAVLHWLADELHYEPKDTRELLAKASRNNRIECGLYIMRRWPHRFTAVPVASVRLFFSACLARECSLWWVFRLVSHLERSRAYSPAALDLWSVLKSRLSDNASWTLIPALGRLGPVLDDSGDDITLPIGHVPSTGVHVKDNVIAAWKRLVSCMAVGECPSRADVRSLLDPPRPPVSLNTLCGVDCRVYFLGNEESCDDDDDIKCSDEKCNYSRRALERLALLGRWLTPHVH